MMLNFWAKRKTKNKQTKKNLFNSSKRKKKWTIAGIEPGLEGNRYKDSRIGLTDLHSV